jgi:hypothetical protein
MIIVYQIRNLSSRSELASELRCPCCNETGGIAINVIQKYVWFLMPMWPVGKYGMVTCSNCSQKIPVVRWTDEIKLRYLILKKDVKTPARLWRGLFVVPLLFAVFLSVVTWLVVSGSNSYKGNKNSEMAYIKEYLAKPKENDLYRVMTISNNQIAYTYFKYAAISGDTLFVYPMKEKVSGFNQWGKLKENRPDAFTNEKIPVNQPALLKQLESWTMQPVTVPITLYGVIRDGQFFDTEYARVNPALYKTN